MFLIAEKDELPRILIDDIKKYYPGPTTENQISFDIIFQMSDGMIVSWEYDSEDLRDKVLSNVDETVTRYLCPDKSMGMMHNKC